MRSVVLLSFAAVAVHASIHWKEVAKKSIEVLQDNFFNVSESGDSGAWTSRNRWNNANSLETVCNFLKKSNSSLNSSSRFLQDAELYFEAAENIGTLLDSSDDDSLWFASAWSCMFELTRNETYLNFSLQFYDSVDSGGAFAPAWDNSTCSGGVWWDRKNRGYKNAITNELYLFASLRLKNAVRGTKFQSQWEQKLLANAQKETDWFLRSGMINSEWLINDGLNPDCSNNGATTWTYNQGVVLSGLGLMYVQTLNKTYMTVAENVIDAVIKKLTSQSQILIEPCESSSCSTDGQQFKGIFMRHLKYFVDAVGLDLPENSRDQYNNFLLNNALSIYQHAQNATSNPFKFGYRWSGPVTEITSISQTAAIDVFNTLI
jgi:hypothetical protein